MQDCTMDRISQETLRRVGENDETLTELSIRDYGDGGIFNSTANGDDYSRLGTFIGENTHLTTLNVAVCEELALKNITENFLMVSFTTHRLVHWSLIVSLLFVVETSLAE